MCLLIPDRQHLQFGEPLQRIGAVPLRTHHRVRPHARKCVASFKRSAGLGPHLKWRQYHAKDVTEGVQDVSLTDDDKAAQSKLGVGETKVSLRT